MSILTIYLKQCRSIARLAPIGCQAQTTGRASSATVQTAGRNGANETAIRLFAIFHHAVMAMIPNMDHALRNPGSASQSGKPVSQSVAVADRKTTLHLVRDFQNLEIDRALGNFNFGNFANFFSQQTATDRTGDQIFSGVVVFVAIAHQRNFFFIV